MAGANAWLEILSAGDVAGMMLVKGNYPQMALFQLSEWVYIKMIIHVSRIYGCSDPELESNVEVSIISRVDDLENDVKICWKMMSQAEFLQYFDHRHGRLLIVPIKGMVTFVHG